MRELLWFCRQWSTRSKPPKNFRLGRDDRLKLSFSATENKEILIIVHLRASRLISMCSPYPTSRSLSMKHEIPCPGQVSAGKTCGQRRERKLYTWVLCPLEIQILVWLLKEQGFIFQKQWSLCWFSSFPCTNLWRSSIFYILWEELPQCCRGKTHQNFKWWTLNQKDMPRNLRQSVWNWFYYILWLSRKL